MTSKNDFFLVWNPAARAPQYRHPTLESARAEAERLASANPREKFYVLAPIGVAQRVDVQYTDLNTLPF